MRVDEIPIEKNLTEGIVLVIGYLYPKLPLNKFTWVEINPGEI